MKKPYIPGLYDCCQCNHESLQHGKSGLLKCSAIVPIGKETWRGWVDPKILSKNCSCKKFKYSVSNSENIKPSQEL
jgi:hypothetical protein